MAGKQFCKLQHIFHQDFPKGLLIKMISVQNPDFTAVIFYIFNDFIGFGFMNRKLIFIVIKFLCHGNKSFDSKGIMLHGNTEFFLRRSVLYKAVFHHMIEFHHLPGMA